ncbi:ADP-ribosylglycohydrolase family protein [Schlesneria paludicola]|uniref:ADP-ribosylglycohydrolase family protein n=1 Tax=Schlesneria paludicola TaxID=360056 RepID=UPI000299F972|nr:ADP-ribosylglycohydrolase family protein [Schlesneria paludicola]
MTSPQPTDSIAGAILGCAVGDAIGLPYEGLSRQRATRLIGVPNRHRFLMGRGMVSDDTEHTCFVAESLCREPRDVDQFARELGIRLRWWLVGLPAGIGFATLRATVKLWLGYGASHSGVFSAGNGPAMRSPILGAAIDDLDLLRDYVHASTRITHTDPKAFHGALAVAIAAWCAKRGLSTPGAFFEKYRSLVDTDTSDEFQGLMKTMASSLAAGDSTEIFADQLGCRRGVSGYVYHTVPVVLHCWLSHPRDYQSSIQTVIRCGGDTDTTAAIVGAIVGAEVGRSGIPPAWLNGLCEWPRSVDWMERLADATDKAMQTGDIQSTPRYVPIVGLGRNAVFLSAVMVHIARRMLPPY